MSNIGRLLWYLIDQNKICRGTAKLFVFTWFSAIILFFPDGTSHRQIFDKSLQVRQLNVVEPHGILLLRAGTSNKDCKIYVFRLSQIEANMEIRTRIDVKDQRMEKTRGTNLYALSRPGKHENGASNFNG